MFASATKNFSRRAQTSKLAAPSTRAKSTCTLANRDEFHWLDSKILLTGVQGQIGVPLAHALCKELGAENVIATDVAE